MSNIIATLSAPSESHTQKSGNSRKADLKIVIQFKEAALKRCHSHLCSDAKSGSAAPAVFPFQCTGGLLFFSFFFPTYFHIKSKKDLMERNKKAWIPASLFLVCFSTHQWRIPPSTPAECAVWPLIREPGGGVKGQREWGREIFFSFKL